MFKNFRFWLKKIWVFWVFGVLGLLFILILKWNKQGCFCPDFISFFEFKMEHSLFYYKYTQNILNLKWNKFNFL